MGHARTVLIASLALLALAGCATQHPHLPGPVDRTGPDVPLATMGAPLTLTGRALAVGQPAPDFTLTDRRGRVVRLFDYRDKVLLLSIVPELGTAVCDQTTLALDASDLNNDERIVALTVSTDTRAHQRQWATDNHIRRHMTVSTAPDAAFGAAYGLRIAESGRLARAILVIGPDGVIRYIETQQDLARSPDLEKAKRVAQELAGKEG